MPYIKSKQKLFSGDNIQAHIQPIGDGGRTRETTSAKVVVNGQNFYSGNLVVCENMLELIYAVLSQDESLKVEDVGRRKNNLKYTTWKYEFQVEDGVSTLMERPHH